MRSIRIPKGFFKQLSVYKTFKFSLYNVSSLFLYFKIVQLSFAYKVFKENIEYFNEETIKDIRNKLIDINNLLPKKISYIKIINKPILTLEFVIEKDLQHLYDIFRFIDRQSYLDDNIFELKKEFFILIDELYREIKNLIEGLPNEKKKKINRFEKYIKRILNEL